MAKNIDVKLPRPHKGQREVFAARQVTESGNPSLNVVCCGRRWGKTKMMVMLAAYSAAKGRKVGLFTPEHKQLQEPYSELLWLLTGVETAANKTNGIIKTMGNGINEGQVDFWSLNDNELAGRGFEYDRIMIDEAAWTKDNQMYNIWEKSINPTMATRRGAAVWAFSTPRGIQSENFFWRICHKATKFDFKMHYAPSSANPLVSAEFLAEQKSINRPEVYDQEYLAKFIDWSGFAFFEKEKLLVDGKPVPMPVGVEAVFAVIDTAVKEGRSHDATAVSYWATMPSWFTDYRLVCLGWDLVSIDGALLEVWIKTVFSNLEAFAKSCKAVFGSTGAFIEDAQSGSILLQQCALRGWPAEALPAKLTSVGKDGRAINASGPVWRGEVKMAEGAWKVSEFRDSTRNHMMSQVTTFHIGDKEASRRSDDLLDTFCYSVAITLGDMEGIA